MIFFIYYDVLFFVQAVWKANAVQWCPVWTACPALWSGSPPITAACCRLLTAQDPHRRQLCRWVKQALPRRPLRSRLRLPVRTPAWFTKSYRPSHIDIQLGNYNKLKKSPNLVKPSSHKNTHTHTHWKWLFTPAELRNHHYGWSAASYVFILFRSMYGSSFLPEKKISSKNHFKCFQLSCQEKNPVAVRSN